MKINEAILPPYAYSIVNPNMRLALLNDEGHIVALAMKNDAPYGITVADYQRIESLGAITIHEIGGNDLADMYGRTRVTYTINN